VHQDQALTLNISLETSKVDAIAETYPEPIREDYIWLAGYVRDRCSRNLDLLTHRVRKLGFTTDKTTFSKIFRGRYHRDSEGNPAPPCINARNFEQIVSALRSEAQIVWISGKTPFIETGTWTRIEEYITDKRAPETICKFGLILGPTGSQKTSCGKRYALLNNSGKVIHIEAPEKPTMGRFVRELGKAYGIAEKVAGEKLRIRITENVTEKKCIIIDNIQRLYKPRQGWNQEIFNFLQKLQDDTGCTIIMISIPPFEETLRAGDERGYFEQFIGRIGGWHEVLRLDDQTPRADLEAIAEAYGLKDASSHWKELEGLCREAGRIRILFNALQKAKRKADAANQKLTIRHLRAVLGKEDKDD
jgi:AAA domain-containing protein